MKRENEKRMLNKGFNSEEAPMQNRDFSYTSTRSLKLEARSHVILNLFQDLKTEVRNMTGSHPVPMAIGIISGSEIMDSVVSDPLCISPLGGKLLPSFDGETERDPGLHNLRFFNSENQFAYGIRWTNNKGNDTETFSSVSSTLTLSGSESGINYRSGINCHFPKNQIMVDQKQPSTSGSMNPFESYILSYTTKETDRQVSIKQVNTSANCKFRQIKKTHLYLTVFKTPKAKDKPFIIN